MPTGQSEGLSRARLHDGGGGDGNGNVPVTSRDCGRNAHQGLRGNGSHNCGGLHGGRVLHVRNGLRRSNRFLYIPVRGVPHICT